LLKIAKDKAKAHAKHFFFGGAVDFMVMKSITMVTNKIPNFRKAALGDASARRLTARPYTWHEFAGLLKTVRALKKARVPRSQLYRLRQVLDADQGGGVVASVMEYLYTRARLRGDMPRVLMEHIEHNWCHAPMFTGGRMGMPPWLPLGERGSSWETFWPDLLEAYEMVPEGDER
jgi:CRISPR-associated protein Cmr2